VKVWEFRSDCRHFLLYMNAKPFHCSCRYSVHSVLCDFIVNPNIVVSFHHDIRARIRDYWATAEQFLTSFYGNTLKRDRPVHILRFLHYRGNNSETDRKVDIFDRLWEIRTIFDTLNDAYENYYNPSEHLAADEIILKLKERDAT
jgi:hypothetical protein